MTATDIVSRMRDCLVRQIAWFVQLRDELASLRSASSAVDWERLASAQASHMAKTQQLEEEVALLLREWHAAPDIGEADRAAVRSLAREAEALAAEIGELYEQGLEKAQREQDAVGESLDALQRGKGILKKYLPRVDRDASRIDRKA